MSGCRGGAQRPVPLQLETEYLGGQRRAAKGRTGEFERVGDVEEDGFVADGTNELEADREAVGRGAARNRNGREASKIGRAIVAEEQRARGMVRSADERGF